MTSAFVGAGLSIPIGKSQTCLINPPDRQNGFTDIFKSNNTNCCEPAATEMAIAYPSLS
ncbi:hypothetical protein [Chroococcidiopsis thermalis]|uniref:hypothetical protein n=1 Tax=Chroococcidiopsis thermalis TaxID=54299 RepID=UPI0015F0D671|nr:hypothetical protein [Chroococcidiopsis thermalis]